MKEMNMTDQNETLEEWREVAQGLVEECQKADEMIKNLINDLKKVTGHRDRLYVLSRKQHNLLVEAGLIDSEEIVQ